MATARNGDVELYYDTSGVPGGPPVLLVNGFGSQCVSWPDGLLDAFGAAGFQVIRFDNRDVGLSHKTPPPAPRLSRIAKGEETPPYVLSHMAADAVAVLDAVGVERAHVWGASMGGMIAQTMAIEFPERVASLTSVMSTTGSPAVAQGNPEALRVLREPLPAERDAYIDVSAAHERVTHGPLYDEAWSRERARRSYDRCHHPLGRAFQMAAIVASPDRTEALGALDVPTTVIHGAADPLVLLAGGEATAAAIPGARLVVLEAMGHNHPAPYWPTYVTELTRLTELATENRF
jgi:pimeloyl-ACP methyl ester carboxylesterase